MMPDWSGLVVAVRSLLAARMLSAAVSPLSRISSQAMPSHQARVTQPAASCPVRVAVGQMLRQNPH